METNSKSNSFRSNRKLIEEMAPQRRLDDSNDERNKSLNDISNNLQDVQAAIEIGAEVTEDKGNQIIQIIGTGNTLLQDIVAGAEITSEAQERTTNEVRNLGSLTSKMSEKIGKLSEMLGEKIKGTGTQVAPAENTTLEAIKESMPLKVEETELRSLIEKLLPQNPGKPDSDFPEQPTLPGPSSDNEDKKKEESDFKIGELFKDLTKVSKKGFGAMIGIGDKIAGLLLSVSVSAALQLAKTTAMILALVMGFDQIRVMFSYIQKQFKENFDNFFTKFEEWGGVFQSLVTAVDNITNAFSEGNFSKLVIAILKGIGNIAVQMTEIVIKGVNELIAEALRSMGFDSKADEMELNTLENYQRRSGNSLDEEDSNRLAELQDNRNVENFKDYDKTKDRLQKTVSAGYMSQEDMDITMKNKYGDYKGEGDSFMSLPKEERLKRLKERNEAQAEIKQLTNIIEQTDNMDDETRKNVMAKKSKIDSKLQDPELSSVPQANQLHEMNDVLNKLIDSKLDGKVKGVPTEVKEDTQAIKRTQQAEKAKIAATGTPAGNLAGVGAVITQNNTKISNAKTMYNIPPTSATAAPGMKQSQRLN